MYFPDIDEVPKAPIEPIKPVFFYGRNIPVSVDQQPDPQRMYDPQKFHPTRILWEK